MKRTVTISHSFQEAEEKDILQQISMTPDERQAAARELKRRFYGDNPPDVRESTKK